MKPPIGSFPDAVSGQEAVTKSQGDSVYAPIGTQASAQGDLMYATMSADDNQGTPNEVAFNTTQEVSGDITLVGNEFSLKAGRTYQLLASLQIDHGSPSSCNYQWYDATNAVLLGKEQEILTTTAGGINRSTQSVAAYIFTPSVDTLVHVRRVGGTSNANINAERSWAMITEVGAVYVSGGLEFVDVINVTGDQQSVSFGSVGDGDNLTALNGDVDEEYFMEGDILAGAAAAIEYVFRPNGVSTGQECNRTTASAGSLFGGLHSELRLSNQASLSVGTLHRIESTLRAKTGQFRTFTGKSVLMEGATVTEHHGYGGGWSDTATNITSMEIRASVAAGIKDGSKITLYRRRKPTA